MQDVLTSAQNLEPQAGNLRGQTGWCTSKSLKQMDTHGLLKLFVKHFSI